MFMSFNLIVATFSSPFNLCHDLVFMWFSPPLLLDAEERCEEKKGMSLKRTKVEGRKDRGCGSSECQERAERLTCLTVLRMHSPQPQLMMTSLRVIIKIYDKQPYPKMKYKRNKEKERD